MNGHECYIIGAGDFFGLREAPDDSDYVIAADAGFEHSGKMAGGGKSEIGPDSGQRFIRIAEEAFCFLRFFLQDEIRQALARLLPAIKSSVTDLRFEQKKASVLTAFQML